MLIKRILTVTALVAGTGALPLAAQADDFRWEAGAFLNRDSFDGEHADNWGLYGTYYFRDVKEDSVPLEEAAFLERTGFVSLSPARFESDFGHFDSWRLSSDYYGPGNWLYLSAGVTRNLAFEQRLSGNTAIAARVSDTSWDATVGITPFAGLRLATSLYEHADYQPNLDIKYVGKLGNDHFYGFGVTLVDPDRGDFYYNLSADYFIDRTLRVGVEAGQDLDRWGISADKFFTEKASVGIQYTGFSAAHSVGLRAAWRF
jgi:hypothetical protein